MGTRYRFRDIWTAPCSLDVAWRMVDDVQSWPLWWPDYRAVEQVSEVAHGVGAGWRARVRANLPYTLDFTFTVLEHEPPTFVRVSVKGFFTGEISWKLESDGAEATRLTLREETETRWPLINLAARLGARRFLEANHAAAMRRGESGLRAALARGYAPPRLDS